MTSITNIIVAETEQGREAAVAALRKRNAETLTDGEVLAGFLFAHVASDGTPLAPPVCGDCGAVHAPKQNTLCDR